MFNREESKKRLLDYFKKNHDKYGSWFSFDLENTIELDGVYEIDEIIDAVIGD